ncbi:MAG TPA: hypothetical protein VFW66_00025 [Gemmatimonadales bacterium]|nr:hypothetical protein [Gemmatimonadales bacterium]
MAAKVTPPGGGLLARGRPRQISAVAIPTSARTREPGTSDAIDSAARSPRDLLIAALFFVSGFAAILYQVVWERTLFAVIGINVEAVALIVTLFILGLGLGSLAGGYASRVTTRSLIGWFAAIELGTGLYGLASLPLFHLVGRLTLDMSPVGTGLMVALIVLPPTMAMGATLPLLVADAVGRNSGVGEAVGLLYFVNTIGSATAAFAAGLTLMRALGQSGVVLLAALCNLAVATIATATLRRAALRRA